MPVFELPNRRRHQVPGADKGAGQTQPALFGAGAESAPKLPVPIRHRYRHFESWLAVNLLLTGNISSQKLKILSPHDRNISGDRLQQRYRIFFPPKKFTLTHSLDFGRICFFFSGCCFFFPARFFPILGLYFFFPKKV